jgi:hypothetical protein
MLAALSEGAGWCVYAGHGNSSLWAAEGLLRTSDGAAFAAAGGSPQPVSVELTCLTGRFDGFSDSLAEAMLKHESGGFAGTVAPAGVADLAAQLIMARSLFPALRRGEDLGHALMSAKRAVWPVERRTAFSFNLLGDPAGR